MSEELPFKFLSWVTPLGEFRTVFDVGANVGNMTSECLRQFPNARIWAFEPIASTFEQLHQRFSNEQRVSVVRGALGEAEAMATMLVVPGTVGCSIVEQTYPGRTYEDVHVISGDAFLQRSNLERIDFLKVDTEGHDLKVLRGFSAALQARKIQFLQVEVGMNSTNRRHVPLPHFLSFLEPLGYHMLRVINQVGEIDGRRILRRADVLFSHSD